MSRPTLLACALGLLSGCVYAVNDLEFRTAQPESAFDRAVATVQANCNGTSLVDKDRHLVFSHWQAWPTGDGIVLSRCMVSLVEQPADRSDDVRVAFTMKQCPLADLDDLDALAEKCTVTLDVPELVANRLNLAAAAIEHDLRR